MTDPALTDSSLVGDDELVTALRLVLAEHFGRPREIVSLKRELAAYRASFHLEELELCLDGGTSLSLIFKDVGQQLGTAQRVKPPFLYNPRREIDAYSAILDHERLGTAICYGSVVRPDEGQYWLFIERIEGTRLRELGEFTTWQLAARWLAALHVEYAPRVDQLREQTYLLRCDREYLAGWIERARQVAGTDAAMVRQIGSLAKCCDTVLDRMAALPVTLIHGEFYPSNILVRDTPAGAVVSPVDWEMAGVGPGLLDLAAFTSGGWSEDDAVALARSYYDAATPAFEFESFDSFLHALDCCRLFLSIQWLGWSADWAPPPEHTHDWLKAAGQLAKRVKAKREKSPRRPAQPRRRAKRS